MRRMVLCLLLAGILFAGAGPAAADDGESYFGGGISLPVYTSYVWRGQLLNPRGVFQPQAWLAAGGAEIGVGGNVDLTDQHGHRGELNEVDFFLGYSLPVGPVEAAFSYEYFHYPLSDYGYEKTQELGLEFSWGEPLTISLQAYYDFDSVKGWYLRGGISYLRELDLFTIVPSATVGWASRKSNDYNFDTAKNGLVDLELKIETSAPLGSGFSIFAQAAYFALLDGSLRDWSGRDRDGCWGGGGLTFEF